MAGANAILLALQAAQPTIRGVVIRDSNDPATWTFDGATDVPAAIGIVQQTLQPPVASSQFWPAPQTALEREVAELRHLVTGG